MMMSEGTWNHKSVMIPKNYLECPFCGYMLEEQQDRLPPRYCGGCGAKLVEDKGGED